ncbi:YEATS family domain-containing protein [Phthorimaea operculella]|nr:YEATS family domain-containing protein [Phthorimaea operculella]
MDRQEEYHDPDYPGTSAGAPQGASDASEDEKVEKIRRIVRREFSNELDAREREIMLIDQRSLTARRMLQRLRYAIVNNYYNEERLKLSLSHIQDEVSGQSEPRAQAAVSTLLREGQRRLHPSVRKLLGKQSSTMELHEILFRRRAPRNKARKDYSAMLQARNYTISADTTKSLRPSSPEIEPASSHNPTKPKKVPRRFDPKITNVMTLDQATRNQMKHRYRIIIGNTSKYAPPASAADRSTHKWLLYVRGTEAQPDISAIVTAVTVRLHHSYAPHHTVHIDKPPFHVSRRGWGEFPAQVELHFALPQRNRPATVTHTIKLDRNYTGFQTLGAETVVDVWLYSTEEMLQYEFKDDMDDTDAMKQIDSVKQEQIEPTEEDFKITQENNIESSIENSIFDNQDGVHTENWLDFFSNATELDVDEMIIKPQKKVEEKNDLESLIETNIISKEKEDKTDGKVWIDIPPNVEPSPKIKQEIIEPEPTEPEYNHQDIQQNNDSDLISKNIKKEPIEDMPNELLTTSPKKRIMKYMDPTTGKIYYLEMDRKLDLSKVQEIVINSKGHVKTAKISPIKPNGLKNVRKNTKKGGVSLLKPEIKSLLKNETTKTQQTQQNTALRKNFSHIENDHCYIGPAPFREPSQSLIDSTYLQSEPICDETNIKQEQSVFDCICAGLKRLCCVKVAVDFCLRKIPLISSEARDPDFLKHFPFVVETDEKYWKLDFAKRRNIEWSRCKLINKLLTEHLTTTETIWRTKQILIYSRLHGYFPVRPETNRQPTRSETDWSSWTDLDNSRKTESNIKEIYPTVQDICTLTKFNQDEFSQNLSESIDVSNESDEEVEIIQWEQPVKCKKEVLPDVSADLPVLPVMDSQERLRFMFLERKCADIGIELRNEDVGNGYSYSAVHAVLLSAMKSFASELIRAALADRLTTEREHHPLPPVWQGSSSSRPLIALEHVYRGATSSARLHALTARHLGTETTQLQWL